MAGRRNNLTERFQQLMALADGMRTKGKPWTAVALEANRLQLHAGRPWTSWGLRHWWSERRRPSWRAARYKMTLLRAMIQLRADGAGPTEIATVLGHEGWTSVRGAPLDRRHVDYMLRQASGSRPRFRGDCENGPRPCPYVGCRHHLGVTVAVNGDIYERLEGWKCGDAPAEDVDTCALDVAARGVHTLEAVGKAMKLSYEQVRRIETSGLRKLRAAFEAMDEHG